MDDAPPPPPSPLSGCYLLIVLGEPHSPEHRDVILGRVAKGFLSWDIDSSHVDLEKELQALTSQAPAGEQARNGERLIQYATENLVTEVLIHPQINTLLQCVRNALSSFTRHRHLIHAGYTFASSGSWILQDGTFSLADFIDAFQESEVQRVLRAYENGITVDVHCSPEGDWTTERMSKEAFSRFCKVRVNPDDRMTAGGTAIGNFINYLSPFLKPTPLEGLLESSDVVGNIRFSHPTLYVFPGGQGDAALFGINGFNMLVDGGFTRKACFWDFARHLDRLDAVLITRLNNGNVNGIASVLRRKKGGHVYPQIGHFFCNMQEKRQATSPDGDKDRDPLLVDLAAEAHEMVINLRQLSLRPHPCYSHTEPVNLYHKVGHGKLDMYVLSPARDSREVKDFLSRWASNDVRLFSSGRKDSTRSDFIFPLQNLVSICALLVWQPANPNESITRILFPGSTPQHKIFEGVEKLRYLEFLKHPVCSARSLSPSASSVGISSRKQQQIRSSVPAVIDKLLPGEGVKQPPIPAQSKPDKQILKSATIPVSGSETPKQTQKPAAVPAATKATQPPIKQKTERIPSKTEPSKSKTDIVKPLESEKMSAKTEKTITKTTTDISKQKSEQKTRGDAKISAAKSKPDTKPPKPTEKKAQKAPSSNEKKTDIKSSPTTPKKTIEPKVNGVAPKGETVKPTRASSKTRPSPTATPAKSAKDANNRKVVESKYHVSRVSKSTTSKSSKIEDITATTSSVKTERKPISRRPKPTPGSPGKISPSRKPPGSPAKSSSAKSTPTPSVKSDKDGVIRRARGETGKITTDSSAVSTPSTAEPESTIKAKEIEVSKLAVENGHDEKNITELKTDIHPDTQEIMENIEKVELEITSEPSEKTEQDTEDTEKHVDKETTVEVSDEIVTSVEVKEVDAETEVELKESKQSICEKEDIEAAEEEQTEDIEEEEAPVEVHESLKTELELDEKPETADVTEENEEDDEDEYLIIEKEDVESIQEQESVESHLREEYEARDTEFESSELPKHLKDEVESEKLGKIEDDKEPEVTEQADNKLKMEEELDDSKQVTQEPQEHVEKIETIIPQVNGISSETKEQLDEEVQEIISSAKDIVTKTKLEDEPKSFETSDSKLKEISHDIKEEISESKKDIETSDELKEVSSESPEEKVDISSEKNREITETDQKLEGNEVGEDMKETVSREMLDQKYPAEESQPDEKFSTTIESGATTAPTLPEDERIPLDEIKEIVEEKYIREETKEKEEQIVIEPRIEQPTTLPQVVLPIFEAHTPQAMIHRDIVKTPDEVADLPVHEEVDPGMYDTDDFTRDFHKSKDEINLAKQQQELEDTRQEPSEIDIRGELHIKEDPENKLGVQKQEEAEIEETELSKHPEKHMLAAKIIESDDQVPVKAEEIKSVIEPDSIDENKDLIPEKETEIEANEEVSDIISKPGEEWLEALILKHTGLTVGEEKFGELREKLIDSGIHKEPKDSLPKEEEEWLNDLFQKYTQLKSIEEKVGELKEKLIDEITKTGDDIQDITDKFPPVDELKDSKQIIEVLEDVKEKMDIEKESISDFEAIEKVAEKDIKLAEESEIPSTVEISDVTLTDTSFKLKEYEITDDTQQDIQKKICDTQKNIESDVTDDHQEEMVEEKRLIHEIQPSKLDESAEAIIKSSGQIMEKVVIENVSALQSMEVKDSLTSEQATSQKEEEKLQQFESEEIKISPMEPVITDEDIPAIASQNEFIRDEEDHKHLDQKEDKKDGIVDKSLDLSDVREEVKTETAFTDEKEESKIMLEDALLEKEDILKTTVKPKEEEIRSTNDVEITKETQEIPPPSAHVKEIASFDTEIDLDKITILKEESIITQKDTESENVSEIQTTCEPEYVTFQIKEADIDRETATLVSKPLPEQKEEIKMLHKEVTHLEIEKEIDIDKATPAKEETAKSEVDIDSSKENVTEITLTVIKEDTSRSEMKVVDMDRETILDATLELENKLLSEEKGEKDVCETDKKVTDLETSASEIKTSKEQVNDLTLTSETSVKDTTLSEKEILKEDVTDVSKTVSDSSQSHTLEKVADIEPKSYEFEESKSAKPNVFSPETIESIGHIERESLSTEEKIKPESEIISSDALTNELMETHSKLSEIQPETEDSKTVTKQVIPTQETSAQIESQDVEETDKRKSVVHEDINIKNGKPTSTEFEATEEKHTASEPDTKQALDKPETPDLKADLPSEDEKAMDKVSCDEEKYIETKIIKEHAEIIEDFENKTIPQSDGMKGSVDLNQKSVISGVESKSDEQQQRESIERDRRYELEISEEHIDSEVGKGEENATIDKTETNQIQAHGEPDVLSSQIRPEAFTDISIDIVKDIGKTDESIKIDEKIEEPGVLTSQKSPEAFTDISIDTVKDIEKTDESIKIDEKIEEPGVLTSQRSPETFTDISIDSVKDIGKTDESIKIDEKTEEPGVLTSQKSPETLTDISIDTVKDIGKTDESIKIDEKTEEPGVLTSQKSPEAFTDISIDTVKDIGKTDEIIKIDEKIEEPGVLTSQKSPETFTDISIDIVKDIERTDESIKTDEKTEISDKDGKDVEVNVDNKISASYCKSDIESITDKFSSTGMETSETLAPKEDVIEKQKVIQEDNNFVVEPSRELSDTSDTKLKEPSDVIKDKREPSFQLVSDGPTPVVDTQKLEKKDESDHKYEISEHQIVLDEVKVKTELISHDTKNSTEAESEGIHTDKETIKMSLTDSEIDIAANQAEVVGDYQRQDITLVSKISKTEEYEKKVSADSLKTAEKTCEEFNLETLADTVTISLKSQEKDTVDYQIHEEKAFISEDFQKQDTVSTKLPTQDDVQKEIELTLQKEEHIHPPCSKEVQIKEAEQNETESRLVSEDKINNIDIIEKVTEKQDSKILHQESTLIDEVKIKSANIHEDILDITDSIKFEPEVSKTSKLVMEKVTIYKESPDRKSDYEKCETKGATSQVYQGQSMPYETTIEQHSDEHDYPQVTDYTQFESNVGEDDKPQHIQPQTKIYHIPEIDNVLTYGSVLKTTHITYDEGRFDAAEFHHQVDTFKNQDSFKPAQEETDDLVSSVIERTGILQELETSKDSTIRYEEGQLLTKVADKEGKPLKETSDFVKSHETLMDKDFKPTFTDMETFQESTVETSSDRKEKVTEISELQQTFERHADTQECTETVKEIATSEIKKVNDVDKIIKQDIDKKVDTSVLYPPIKSDTAFKLESMKEEDEIERKFMKPEADLADNRLSGDTHGLKLETVEEDEMKRSLIADKLRLSSEDQVTEYSYDGKDDGEPPPSPGEDYIDSGLEEEPVFTKLDAPELPEYVMVTPDSTPASPKALITSSQEVTRTPSNVKFERVDGDSKSVNEIESDKTAGADTKEFSRDDEGEIKVTIESSRLQEMSGQKQSISVDIGENKLVLQAASGMEVSSDSTCEAKSDVKEANILDDLVSARQTAFAAIESKFSTEVGQFLLNSQEIITSSQETLKQQEPTGQVIESDKVEKKVVKTCDHQHEQEEILKAETSITTNGISGKLEQRDKVINEIISEETTPRKLTDLKEISEPVKVIESLEDAETGHDSKVTKEKYQTETNVDFGLDKDAKQTSDMSTTQIHVTQPVCDKEQSGEKEQVVDKEASKTTGAETAITTDKLFSDKTCSLSAKHVSKTTNGDIYSSDHESIVGSGDEDAFGKHYITTKTTKTTRTIIRSQGSASDSDDTDHKDSVTEETFTGEDGRIITRKVTKRYKTVVKKECESEDDAKQVEKLTESSSESPKLTTTTRTYTTITREGDDLIDDIETEYVKDIEPGTVSSKTTTTVTTITKRISAKDGEEEITTATTEEITSEDGKEQSTVTVTTTRDAHGDVLVHTSITPKDKQDDNYSLISESSDLDKISDTFYKGSMSGVISNAEKISKEILQQTSTHLEKDGKCLETDQLTSSECQMLGNLSHTTTTTTTTTKEESTDKQKETHIEHHTTEPKEATKNGQTLVKDKDLSTVSSTQISGTYSECYESDEEEDAAGSPISITSQAAHSPPTSRFEFETVIEKHKSVFDPLVDSDRLSSLKKTDVISSCSIGTVSSNLSQYPMQETEIVTNIKSEIKNGTSKIKEHEYKLDSSYYESSNQEEQMLDFKQAIQEHRTARGEDLTNNSKTLHSEQEEIFKIFPSINGQKRTREMEDSEKNGHSSHTETDHKYISTVETKQNGKEKEDVSSSFITEYHIVEKISSENGKRVEELSSKQGESSVSQIVKESIAPTIQDKTHQEPSSTVGSSAYPEPPREFAHLSSDKQKDPIEGWGKPLGLPAPAPPPTNNITANGDVDTMTPTKQVTPKKEKKGSQVKKSMVMNENNKTTLSQTGKDSKSKRSESPVKAKGGSNKESNKLNKMPTIPIYVDLTYVPHHGNSYYTSLEFFKKVRARYYVFSGTEPSREVYNALLEAKQTWDDKDLEVTIIPTYDTDTLGYWVSENEELLAKYKIDLSPSASRCTINLQDHETSCSAYRLEF